MSLRRIGTKLVGNSSHTPPGASYTAQGPQKQAKIINNLLYISSTTNQCLDFWTWVLVSIPLELVLGMKFRVDFESAIKNTKFLQPEGKMLEKRKLLRFKQIHLYSFIFSLRGLYRTFNERVGFDIGSCLGRQTAYTYLEGACSILLCPALPSLALPCPVVPLNGFEKAVK